jgi:hypothetical protein
MIHVDENLVVLPLDPQKCANMDKRWGVSQRLTQACAPQNSQVRCGAASVIFLCEGESC